MFFYCRFKGCTVVSLPGFLSRMAANTNNLRMTCCLTIGCQCPLCIARNWVRCGTSSRTNGTLCPCLPFWCDPCVVCFYCPWLLFSKALSPPGSVLSTKNRPVGVDRLLACASLWCCTVLTGWCALWSSTCRNTRLGGCGGFNWLACVGWATAACPRHWEKLVPANSFSIKRFVL